MTKKTSGPLIMTMTEQKSVP